VHFGVQDDCRRGLLCFLSSWVVRCPSMKPRAGTNPGQLAKRQRNCDDQIVSAETQRAEAEFTSAIRDPVNLIWIHQNSQTGRGRRHRQPTLSRAAVVLAAAAWQAYVQDTTEAILQDLAVPTGHQGYALYSLVRAATQTALGRFNTPNAHNTLALFSNVGFDPSSCWAFRIGVPTRVYTTQRVSNEIDGWLQVRHSIAHGFALPASNLVTGRPSGGPSLHRADAERCIEFFERLVSVTAAAANSQFP
jgi:hypothetical protein